MSAVGTEGLNPKMLAAKSFVCQDWVRPLYSTHRRSKYRLWELGFPHFPNDFTQNPPPLEETNLPQENVWGPQVILGIARRAFFGG